MHMHQVKDLWLFRLLYWNYTPQNIFYVYVGTHTKYRGVALLQNEENYNI